MSTSRAFKSIKLSDGTKEYSLFKHTNDMITKQEYSELMDAVLFYLCYPTAVSSPHFNIYEKNIRETILPDLIQHHIKLRKRYNNIYDAYHAINDQNHSSKEVKAVLSVIAELHKTYHSDSLPIHIIMQARLKALEDGFQRKFAIRANLKELGVEDEAVEDEAVEDEVVEGEVKVNTTSINQENSEQSAQVEENESEHISEISARQQIENIFKTEANIIEEKLNNIINSKNPIDHEELSQLVGELEGVQRLAVLEKAVLDFLIRDNTNSNEAALINLIQEEVGRPTLIKGKEQKSNLRGERIGKIKETETSIIDLLQTKILEVQTLLSSAQLGMIKINDKKNLDIFTVTQKADALYAVLNPLRKTKGDIPKVELNTASGKKTVLFNTEANIYIEPKKITDATETTDEISPLHNAHSTKEIAEALQAEHEVEEKHNLQAANIPESVQKEEDNSFPQELLDVSNWLNLIQHRITNDIFSKVKDKYNIGIVLALTEPDLKNLTLTRLLNTSITITIDKEKIPEKMLNKYQALFDLRDHLNSMQHKIHQYKTNPPDNLNKKIIDLKKQTDYLLNEVTKASKESLTLPFFGRKGKVGKGAHAVRQEFIPENIKLKK